MVATSDKNGSTYLWNFRTGRLLARLNDPGSQVGKEVDSLAFSPDGKTLATADGNGYANLWSLPAGAAAGGTGSGAPGAKLIRSLLEPGGVGVYSVAFSSRGMFATGDYSGMVYIWDQASDVTTSSFAMPADACSTGISSAISALAFSADGGLLAVGDKSGSAELWSIARGTGQLIRVPASALRHSIWALSFSGSDCWPQRVQQRRRSAAVNRAASTAALALSCCCWPGPGLAATPPLALCCCWPGPGLAATPPLALSCC